MQLILNILLIVFAGYRYYRIGITYRQGSHFLIRKCANIPSRLLHTT